MARQPLSGMMINSNEDLCGSFDTAYCHLLPSTSCVDEKEANIHAFDSQSAPLPAAHFKPICDFKKEWRTGKQIGWGAYGNVFSVTRKHSPRTPPACESASCSISISPYHSAANSASSNTQTCTNAEQAEPEYAAKVLYFTDDDMYESVQARINAVHAVCNEFKLVRYAGLLNYVDLYYDECNYYKAVIVMERLQHSLSSKRHWNQSCGDTAATECDMYSVKKIARDLAVNIAHIHRLNYAHLDIKKENIMWNASQQTWCLIDYGLARYIPPNVGYVRCSQFVGTKRWTAPEIAISETILHRQHDNVLSMKCDVYSFGLVLLNVAVGGDHYRALVAKKNKEDAPTEQEELRLLRKLTSKQGHQLLRDYLCQLEQQGVIDRGLYTFLSSILVFDPKQRPDMEAVLDMDYLKKK